jgi:hypothetical protein
MDDVEHSCSEVGIDNDYGLAMLTAVVPAVNRAVYSTDGVSIASEEGKIPPAATAHVSKETGQHLRTVGNSENSLQ